MLENKKFVEWANENIVVVVGHTEANHPTETENAKGKMVPGCPLYHGMTCEQHRAIQAECANPPEDAPAVKSTGMMPNSWFVTPSGEVTQIESRDQQSPGKIEDLVAALQKEAGKHLTWKKYSKYLAVFEASDAALRDGKLKEAIKTLAKVEKDTKKLPAGMNAAVTTRFDAINAKALEELESIKDAIKEGDAGVGIKAANKLKNNVSKRFKRGYLPVVEQVKAWLKEAKAAAK